MLRILCRRCDCWYLCRLTIPNLQVELASDFTNSRYSGTFCGVTVFSSVMAMEGPTACHAITLPLVDTFNRMGMSTFMIYGSTYGRCVSLCNKWVVFYNSQGNYCCVCGKLCRPKQPLLHTYYYYGNPVSTSRARRYIAYQMDYSKAMVESKDCLL